MGDMGERVMETRICNAKIKSTMLGPEDHGIMTFFVFVEWPGSSCGLGGYALDGYGGAADKARDGHGQGYQAIRHILDTLGMASWEKLPGTLLRVEAPVPGRGLTRIGHIMEDRWFDIEAYMKEAS